MNSPAHCPNCQRDVSAVLAIGVEVCPWCHGRLIGVPEIPQPPAGLRPRTAVGRGLWFVGSVVLKTAIVIAGGFALLLGLAFAACGVCH